MANIHAARGSRGSGGDMFYLNIIEDDGRSVEIVMTPEQWALAMWSRGDIEVEAKWTERAPLIGDQ